MKTILPKNIEKLLKQELKGTQYEDPKKYQQFVDACRLGVRVIEEKTPAKKIVIGTSKIGGMPDMPKHIPWPSFTENTVDYDMRTNEMKEGPHVHPLSFLAQINCAELPSYMIKLGFPKKGILYFFVNDDTQRLFYLKNESKERARVLYFDGSVKELAPRKIPKLLKDSEDDMFFHREKPTAISFVENLSVNPVIDNNKGQGPTIDAAYQYAGLKIIVEEVNKKLAAAFKESYEYSRLGVFPNWLQEEERSEQDGWVLLLQLISEDYDVLYFMIQESDLKKKNFSRSWCGYQCT